MLREYIALGLDTIIIIKVHQTEVFNHVEPLKILPTYVGTEF